MRAGLCCALALIALGCSPSNPVSGVCRAESDCDSGEQCVDGRCRPRADAGPRPDGSTNPGTDGGRRTAIALEIEPAAPVVVARNGAPAAIDLMLFARYDDGSRGAVAAGFWSVEPNPIGSIDGGTGVFTAEGTLAGATLVRVEALGLEASSTLTVRIEHEVFGEGADASSRERFAPGGSLDPARDAELLYPLSGTVFPQNVFPADVQWGRGVEGDVYRVRFDVPGVAVDAYVRHSGAAFAYDWRVPRGIWRALAESAPETPITLRVDRWEAASGEVIEGAPRTVRFARANILGAIYYWDLPGGRVVRIRGDGSGLEAFMPSPPARPADGRRCVACHTVSHDGRRMAAELWDGGDFGAIFDLTVDLGVDPAPTTVPPNRQRFLTATFSPDNAHLVGSVGNGLFLMDGNTGASVPASLPSAGSAHPAWSPDGTLLAYVSNTNGSWAVDFTRGDLSVLDVTPPATFGAPRTIFPGAPLVVARPSWSPNSQWIAFQHSEHSRAFQDMGSGVPSILRPGVVRMVSRDGATTFDLEALNAGARDSYYPTFSPFEEGGYFWLAFFSTRDYGNAQAGTRGTGRRQLWVSAVSARPTPGVDPSHPPYWLPQQDVRSENMAAQWAPEPCLADGRTCSTSGECCSGFCRDRGAGPICVPPDEVVCSEEGEACRSDSDCCEGAGSCLANRCGSIG